MRFAVVTVGVVAVLTGVGLWSIPAALVTGGVALVAAGLFFDDGKPK